MCSYGVNPGGGGGGGGGIVAICFLFKSFPESNCD